MTACVKSTSSTQSVSESVIVVAEAQKNERMLRERSRKDLFPKPGILPPLKKDGNREVKSIVEKYIRDTDRGERLSNRLYRSVQGDYASKRVD